MIKEATVTNDLHECIVRRGVGAWQCIVMQVFLEAGVFVGGNKQPHSATYYDFSILVNQHAPTLS